MAVKTARVESPETVLFAFIQSVSSNDYIVALRPGDRLRFEPTQLHLRKHQVAMGPSQWRWTCLPGTCDRSVRDVFLPTASTELKCRHCHNLTYRTTQTHDERLNEYRRDPLKLSRAVHEMLNGGRFMNSAALRVLFERQQLLREHPNGRE